MIGARIAKDYCYGYITKGKGMRENTMNADFYDNQPSKFGKVKKEYFAKEFSIVYVNS